MMRSLLIYLSKAGWVQWVVTRLWIARNTALRFVAGETLADAIQVTKHLNAQGMNVTLDLLGEDTLSAQDARSATKEIIGILEEVERTKVRSNISIKLSQLGIKIDPKQCTNNLISILQRARDLNTFVRIDMEESGMVEDTLNLVREMSEQHDFDNVGVVIQSYLYRSTQDIADLSQQGARVRLVKGAYSEPAEIAYPEKADVDRNFDEQTRVLLEAIASSPEILLSKNGKIPPLPAIASHDELRVSFAKQIAQRLELPKNSIEFQFLYGIRVRLQKQLVEEGYPVRIYVPFGEKWFPYFMRRLAERPANLWFFLSSLFGR